MKINLIVVFVMSALFGIQSNLSAQTKTTLSKKSAPKVIRECKRPGSIQSYRKTDLPPLQDSQNLPLRVTTENSDGAGQGSGRGSGAPEKTPPPVPSVPLLIAVAPDADVQFISKPRATYLPEAREKQITGEVVLLVTFLASGKIGKISVIKSLPEGLTEQAKVAASRIRFEPARRNCKDITTSKKVSYSFQMY